ncbi:MAG: 4a-hydroxytetrahydrobiopterin dehydratase [Planctomycetota bacterium]
MSAIPERCRDGAARLDAASLEAMAAELDPAWRREGDAIVRRVELADFAAALAALNAVGAAAEEENHHPDLAITGYRELTVSLTTHDAGGLTANDLVMARRVDGLLARS